MGNVYNYLKQYGIYSFNYKKFNDIDNLVFSSLIYLDLTNMDINGKYTLKEIGSYYLNNKDKLNKYELLLKELINTKRYQNIILSDYVYKRDKNIQFGAVTFKISKKLIYISFEGTDKHISSFKEDANLACFYPVPSQIEAINYVNKHVSLFGPNVIIGGHSKGGNLALVSGMYLKKYKQFKIKKIYSNDGPGLRKKEFESIEYQRIKDKYIHIVPRESIVGMMLRSDKYFVIKSNKKGIKAHSMISWCIKDDKLVNDKLSNLSKKLSNNILNWLDNHDDLERKKIVDKVFQILEEELSNNNTNKIQKVLDIIFKIKSIDTDTKMLIKDLLINIINIRGDNNEKSNRS